MLTLLMFNTKENLKAQTMMDTLARANRAAYDSIPQNLLSTNILMDRALSWVDPFLFGPHQDSIAISAKQYRQGLLDLRNAAWDPTTVLHPDSLFFHAQQLGVSYDTSTLFVANYRYNYINPVAWDTGAIWYDSTANLVRIDTSIHVTLFMEDTFFYAGQVFNDVPLDTGYCLFLPSGMIYSNITTDPSFYNFQVDGHDEQGFVTLLVNTYTHFDQTTELYGLLDVRTDFYFVPANPVEYYRKTKREGGRIVGSGSRSYIGGAWNLQSELSFLGEKAEGIITLLKSDHTPTNCSQKPVIIVEGMDFGDPTSSSRKYGECDGHDCGKNGLSEMLNPTNVTLDNAYAKENEWVRWYPELLKQLDDDGRDVIFVDFREGAGDIRRNAMLLRDVIRIVNGDMPGMSSDFAKYPSCDCEPLVVVGASMGGVVVQYTLAYMEHYNERHNTRLYLSFDAPHKGANIPQGMQYFISTMRGEADGQNEELNRGFENLNRMATRQVLMNHINNISDFTAGPDGERGHLLNALSMHGTYPDNCRKIALPNGSINATANNLSDGTELFNLKVHANQYEYGERLVSRAFATGGEWASNSQYRRLFSQHAVKLFGGSFGEKELKVGVAIDNFDNMPGAGRNHLLDIEPSVTYQTLKGTKCKVTIASIHSTNYEDTRFTFIPTMSALDMDKGWNHNISTDGSIDANLPNSVSPFDAFFGESYSVNLNKPHLANTYHVELLPEHIAWVMTEIRLNDPEQGANVLATGPKSEFNVTNQHSTLGSWTINAGGALYFNRNDDLAGYQGTEQTDGTEFPFATHHNSATSKYFKGGCPTNVEINSGGLLQLGNYDNSQDIWNTADVTFHAGSFLHVKAGGTLRIKNNSTLIFKEGSKLHLWPGAIIELDGNAKIVLEGGQIDMHDDFQWTIDEGFLQFKNASTPGLHPVISSDNSCDDCGITFQGSVSTPVRLQVLDNAKFSLQNENGVHISATIESSKVELGANAQITTTGAFTLSNAFVTAFDEAAPHGGIRLHGQCEPITLANSVIQYGTYGIMAYQVNGTCGLTLDNLRIEGCEYGLWMYNNDLTLTDCEFYFNDHHVSSNNMWNPSSITGTHFVSSSTAAFALEHISGLSTASLSIANSKFENAINQIEFNGNGTGGSALTVQCSKFEDGASQIVAHDADVFVGLNTGGGNVQFEDATNTIFDVSGYSYLDLDQGNNKLFPASSALYMNVIIDQASPPSIFQQSIDYSYNYWNTAGTTPSSSSIVHAINANQTLYVVTVTDGNPQGSSWGMNCGYSGPTLISNPLADNYSLQTGNGARGGSNEELDSLSKKVSKKSKDWQSFAKWIMENGKSGSDSALQVSYHELMARYAVANKLEDKALFAKGRTDNPALDSILTIQAQILGRYSNKDLASGALTKQVAFDRVAFLLHYHQFDSAYKYLKPLLTSKDSNVRYRAEYMTCLASAADSVYSKISSQYDFQRLVAPCVYKKEVRKFTQNGKRTELVDPQKTTTQVAITLYPNPVGSELHLANLPESSKGKAYQIVDIAGRVVATGLLLNAPISVETLMPGIYTLRFQDQVIKFIKKQN